MSHPSFNKIRELLKKHRTQILLLTLFSVLTVMSYLIVGEPAADFLLLPEWATRTLLLPIAILSVVLVILRRHYAALLIYVGYHAGLVLAAIGAEGGTDGLFHAKIIFLSVLFVFLALGVWCEVLPLLFRKWSREN